MKCPLFPATIFLLTPLAAKAATQFKVPFSSKFMPQGLGSVLQAVGLGARSGPDVSLTNAVLKVVASVQAGNDQTFNDVLVDTGSAILWVGGGEEAYQTGPNTQAQVLNADFSVGYGIGGVSGIAFRDKITIGDATAAGQIIGAANNTGGFDLVRPIDGILGLGPSGSNGGEVMGPFANGTTPTFVETLVSEGSIDKAVFGIFIAPLGTDGEPEGTGELTFGGFDESRFQGDIAWVPQNPPLNLHWEFNVTSFSFGNVTQADAAPARTDCGVLGILIPFDSLFDIRDAYHGTLQSGSGQLATYLSLPSNTSSTLPALEFTVGGATFAIPPSRYLIPQSLYPSLNLTQDGEFVHTWISSAGPGSHLFGQKWLESVYTAYDMENHRVGFAHVA